MKKFLLSIFNILVLLFISRTSVCAASEFTTTFNSQYNIEPTGYTTVTHTITLKNNLSHIYATSYSLAISGDDITGIIASDESDSLSSTTNSQNGVTTIKLDIANSAIGKDQIKTLNVTYQTTDVVEVIGDTTTINIPRLARANEAESYTRIVRVKGIMDSSKLIYPEPNKIEPDGEYTIYTFVGHQADSLTLLFGDSVTYKLNLTYELKNKELKASDSELALPPDTGYQHVVIASIDPSPINIRLDDDGNWLARYNLKAQDKLMVKAELYVTVYPKPTQIDPSKTGLIKTARSRYWDTSSSLVTELAERLKTPANIYGYLIDNFTYNYGGVAAGSGRLGALSALSAPTNVLCTEYTDSFVSLSRALSIPSREINGYGYTKNHALQPQNLTTDILHAWPEYYSDEQKKWISIDPTWGNTTGGVDYFNKLDFSHITFVRHGQEDSYPLPAGAYKSNADAKYVEVVVADNKAEERSSSETKDDLIYNTGNVAIYNDEVGYLPPYSSKKLETSKSLSFYDKIRAICVKLLSIFSPQPPASM